ncbi:putative quinol monooxygenase [Nocardia sp. NPDC004711]
MVQVVEVGLRDVDAEGADAGVAHDIEFSDKEGPSTSRQFVIPRTAPTHDRPRRNSAADEPGARRFELSTDADNPNRFYLDEAYDDEPAFNLDAKGPHFARFFDVINSFATGPTWLIRGTRIEDPQS